MSLTTRVLEYLVLSLFIAPFSLRFAKLDKKGSAAAFFVGLVVYVSLGLTGFLVLLSLHLIGAIVTRAGYEKKLKKGIAQKKRSFENVIANGLLPAIAAALSALFNSYSPLFFIAYVSTIAAATADTVSSEIGELSKSKPRLITTFEEVEVGTNGAVSPLGTISGLAASALIALIAVVLDVKGLPFFRFFGIATLAGFTGTTIDSLLGATLERRGIIGNNMVNLISIGASLVVSIAIYSVLV
ncbi:MAG: TIGR00297 family protein [Candidatus Hydrothermarchaeales archaeon]